MNRANAGVRKSPGARPSPRVFALLRGRQTALRYLVAVQLMLICGAAGADTRSADIATYSLSNFGARDKNVAVTFGAIFARGDLPNGSSLQALDSNGRIIPLQLDRKATHSDHSLRHGVITLSVADFPAAEALPVTLRRASGPERLTLPVGLADLPHNFDAVVTLATKGRRLTASARALLVRARPDRWLSGPLVSEWWVAGPLTDELGGPDPHLHVQFGIRCYGKNRPLRIEVIVENAWTHVPRPRTEFYDAQISVGGKTVFEKNRMIQPSHTRWRKGFWWDEPVAVYVKQDLAYLKNARVVPNYDPELVVSQAAVADSYREFEASDRDPMSAGILTKYMPTTGGRPDIAPLPQWQALYLLTTDPRMYQVTLQSADLGASYSSHYRNEKTGRPATLEDFPSITTHSNYVGKPGQLPLPEDEGYADPLVPDAAHEPALDFVPYVVTGDRFYLEELEFWSQWNAMGTAPEYHGFGQGLVTWDQVRAQAWSLRTLAQAEYIAPDADPIKATLGRELRANILWYQAHFLGGADSNNLGLLWQSAAEAPYDNGRSIAPWQDDFFTWALGYALSLGDVSAPSLLLWKSRFPVGRMTAQGFCWILAPAYSMVVRDSSRGRLYGTFQDIFDATLAWRLRQNGSTPKHFKCASEEMAESLGLKTGEMVENAAATGGYSAFLQPALSAAVDAGAPHAGQAWQIFRTRPVQPDYSTEPGWDIVPFSRPVASAPGGKAGIQHS